MKLNKKEPMNQDSGFFKKGKEDKIGQKRKLFFTKR